MLFCDPAIRLSTQTTLPPILIAASENQLPKNPAPPETTNVLSFILGENSERFNSLRSQISGKCSQKLITVVSLDGMDSMVKEKLVSFDNPANSGFGDYRQAMLLAKPVQHRL